MLLWGAESPCAPVRSCSWYTSSIYDDTCALWQAVPHNVGLLCPVMIIMRIASASNFALVLHVPATLPSGLNCPHCKSETVAACSVWRRARRPFALQGTNLVPRWVSSTTACGTFLCKDIGLCVCTDAFSHALCPLLSHATAPVSESAVFQARVSLS